jgi:RsmE family RNA methyltransferase
MNPEKHIFACYYQLLNSIQGNQIISDESLLHRIKNILRLKEGELLILFNDAHHASAKIIALNNKAITVQIKIVQESHALKPDILWLLPLLERESFEQTLNFLAVVGVNQIQPIITEKSRHAWGSPKDYERARKVMIAGCEQAKQFKIPDLLEAKKLDAFGWYSLPQNKFFFDPQGAPFFEILPSVKNKSAFCCFIGPEGDLVAHEKELLKKNNFQFCSLTPTILKAVDANTVVAGILRSYFK